MSSLEARRLCRLAGSALRPADGVGGPEGKLRGRPPPPVEPRSGPWRRTGSEFDAGRAQTRRELSMTDAAAGALASDAREARRRWWRVQDSSPHASVTRKRVTP